ncbi:MAG: Ig-like domain-containing protein, partial [Nocardioidaceae bacterium]
MVSVALAGVVLGPGTGWSYWTAQALGWGTAGTGTLTDPSGVTATAASDTVGVAWTASSGPSGDPEGGYFVTRVRVSDGAEAPACGTSPLSPTATVTCQDTSVPDGTYRYRVTAVHHSWTAQSDLSTQTTVDTAPPAAPSAPQLLPSSDTGDSSSDRITSDATPTFTGTAEPGALVTIYSSGVVAGSAAADEGGGYTITAATLADGALTITAKAMDAAGNTSPESGGTPVTVDTVRPTVTVSQAAGQADPSNTQPVGFTVTFSEPVVGFTTGDLTLSGPAGAFASMSGTGSSYDVSVSGMTADGEVNLSVGADVAFDVAGNGNSASTGDGSVTRDTTA